MNYQQEVARQEAAHQQLYEAVKALSAAYDWDMAAVSVIHEGRLGEKWRWLATITVSDDEGGPLEAVVVPLTTWA